MCRAPSLDSVTYWIMMAVIASFISSSLSAVPFETSSATYEYVENNFRGIQLKYAILDLTFSEEVYYSDNAACGCIDGRTPWCNTKIPTPIVDPDPSAAATILIEGVWHEVAYAPSTETQHFKFLLNPGNYSNECPIVVVEYQSNYGENPLIIGVNRVPSDGDYDFVHNSWTHDSLWICPQHDFYGFGWWHMKSILTSPQVPYTSYRVRWLVLHPDRCVSPPPVPAGLPTPKPSDNWRLLVDNVADIQNVSTPLQHYRFYVDAVCSDLALSARSVSSSLWGDPRFGDPNMMVSWTEPNLDLSMASRIDYHAPIEGDDWLTFRSLCSPTGAAPMILYIVTDNWLSAQNWVQMVVATTKSQNFLVKPLLNLGPNQYFPTLANDFARLECGPFPEGQDYSSNLTPGQEMREHLRSCYPSYWNGCDLQDIWGCQMYWYPIPTNENPNVHVNHFFPDSKSNLNTLFVRDLEWSTFANQTSNTPNKMKFALWLSTREGDTYVQHIHNPVSSCQIRWNNNIVNSAGAPITGYTSFTPKQYTCDPVQFQLLKEQLDRTVNQMQLETNTLDLEMLHVQSQFLISTEDWRACHAYLEQYVQSQVKEVTYPNQQACTEILDTDAFRNDPCCVWRETVNACCEGRDINDTIQAPVSIKADEVDAECNVPECATIPLQRYVDTQVSIVDYNNVCSKSWAQRSSPTVLAERAAFVQQCRLAVYGNDNTGISCQTDADCQTTCNTTNFKCNDGDSEVIACWAANIEPVLARYLFDYWLIPDNFTAQLFTDEIKKRHLIDTCTGPTGLHYRNHWQYTSIYSGCTDACVNPAVGFDIEPYCYEVDGDVCPIPPQCLYSIGIQSCWRVWYFLGGNVSACESTRRCSWLDCVDSGLPGDTCVKNCTSYPTSPTSYACVSCQGEHCVEVPGNLTRSQCLQGQLVNGFCDKLCNGSVCPDQASCERVGVCLNKDDDRSVDTWTNPADGFVYYGVKGMCFSPYLGSYYGDAQCGGDRDYQLRLDQLTAPFMRFGCPCDGSPLANTKCNLNTTRAECNALGFLWVDDAMSELECTNSTVRCYEPHRAWNLESSGAFTNKTAYECEICGYNMQSVLHWEPGHWTPARTLNFSWVARSMVSINRRVQGLDFIGFANDLTRAAFATSALAYSTDSLCRYGAVSDAIAAVTCDCMSDNQTCFGVAPRQLLVDRVCPYVEYNITIPEVSARFYADTFPPVGMCQTVRFQQSAASTYTLSQRDKLTSEVFYEQRPNSYAVVVNNISSFVGQIISSSIDISWNSTEALTGFYTLCIPVDKTIAVFSLYTQLALGVIDDAGRIKVLVISGATYSEVTETVCGNINRQGTFIALTVLSDYATHKNYSPSTAGMAIAAAVLYFVLCFGSLLQAVRFFMAMKNVQNRHLPMIITKIIALVASFLFTLTRGLFFSIPRNVIDATPGNSLWLFEVPGLLFFAMYTSMLYVGLSLIFSIKAVRSRVSITLAYKLKRWTDIAMISLFLVFVITFYMIQEDRSLPCKQPEAAVSFIKHQAVNLAYIIFLGVVSLVMGVAVAVVSIMLICIFRKADPTGDKFDKTHTGRDMLFVILSSFPIMFALRTALLIAAALDATIVIPILVFAILEAFPTAVLLFFIQPFAARALSSMGKTPSATNSGTTGSTKTESTKIQSSKTDEDV